MSVALTSVERINALKNGIEATTGESYADLTAGVQALKNGYGQGGGGGAVDEVGKFLKENSTGLVFFNNKTITETPLIDCSNITRFANAFQGCSKLKTIRLSNTHNVTEWGYCFYGIDVETIETLDFSGASQIPVNCFAGCSKLANLKIVAETISKSFPINSTARLSAESVQSIVDGLAYVTTSQNLTLYKDVVVTDNQKRVIRDKGWTLIQ